MTSRQDDLGPLWTKPKLVGLGMGILSIPAAILGASFWAGGRLEEALLVVCVYIALGLVGVLDMMAAIIRAINGLRSQSPRETE